MTKRRLRQAEPEVVVEEVGCGLADRRAQHLDDPEVERDLRNLVQHRPRGRLPAVRHARGGGGVRCGGHEHQRRRQRPEHRLNGAPEQNLSAMRRNSPRRGRCALDWASPMDYRLYHAVNQFVRATTGSAGSSVPSRPGPCRSSPSRRWPCGSCRPGRPPQVEARVRVGSRLGRSRAADRAGDRQDLAARATVRRTSRAHVWGSRSHDPSFPSDHASAAFAIAFTILLFDLTAGSIFLAAAAVIAIGRVFVGAHYPADVLGGVLVALAAALLVVRLGQPVILRSSGSSSGSPTRWWRLSGAGGPAPRLRAPSRL